MATKRTKRKLEKEEDKDNYGGSFKRKRVKRVEEKSIDSDNDEQQSESWEKASVATTMHIEEDFPRGGQNIITPLERRKLRQQAERDDLFGKSINLNEEVTDEITNDLFPSQEKKKKKATGGGGDETNFVKNKKALYDHLNFKSFVEGMLVLCAVREIQQYKLIVSLPFNFTGSINIGNISDPLASQFDPDSSEMKVPELSKMFCVGQLLPCYILEGGDKIIQLSINPCLVNRHLKGNNLCSNMVVSGCVSSIEDHGYIISFGMTDKTGFLLKKNTNEFLKSFPSDTSNTLTIGQVIMCCVLPGPDARALPVSINPSTVYNCILNNKSSLFSLSSLLPGLLVNATVKQTTPTCILVGFLNGFEGTISIRHAPDFDITPYPVNKKLRARIAWVDMGNKRTGLSLQKEIVSGLGYRFTGMEIGSIYHGATVVYSEPKLGIILKLPNGSHGYAPLRLIQDEKMDKVSKSHSIGSRHSCRIVQLNLIDGLAIVSLQESVLERPFMKLADLKPGTLVEGVVKRIVDKGICVSIGNKFDGFCHETHFSDRGATSKSRKKLTEGSKVKCRVLKVDAPNRFILLTHKQSLISSKLHPLTNITEAKVGEVYDGEVLKVSDRGLLVGFYNGVCGFVPGMELSSNSAQVIVKPQESFTKGQVISCRVLTVDTTTNKLTLTLRKDVTAPLPNEERVCPGMILDLEVSGVTGDGLSLVHSSTGELIYIPLECLSDHTLHCTELLSYYGHGLSEATDKGETYTISNVLILSECTPSSPAIGTLKRLLIDGVREGIYPKDFNDVHVGTILPGIIKKTFSYGCFVAFPNGLIGLAPLRYLSDDFLTDSNGVYRDRQTVLAKVQGKDEEKEKITLSLRSSDLKLTHTNIETAHEVMLKYFTLYQQERDILLNNRVSIGDGEDVPTHYIPGTLVNAQVTSISQSYIHLTLENGAKAKSYVTMTTGMGVVNGSHLTCCILDIATVSGEYWVTLNTKLCRQEKRRETSEVKISLNKQKKIDKYKSQFKLDIGHTVSGMIEHITVSHYCMCTVSTLTGSVLVYGLFDGGQCGGIPFQLRHSKPGTPIKGTVIDLSSHGGSGPPVVAIDTGSKGGFTRPVAKQQEVAVGDIIDVKITSINQSSINVSHNMWRGKIHVTMLKDNLKEGSFPLNDYTPGDMMKARVISQCVKANSNAIQPKTARLDLTTRQSLFEVSVDDLNKTTTYKFGEKVMGVVSEVTKSHLMINITSDDSVFIPARFTPEKSSDCVKKLTRSYQVGQVLSCTLGDQRGGVGGRGQQFYGSLIGPLPALPKGDIIKGYITDKLIDEGLVVKLEGSHLPGLVDITDICDHYLPRPTKYFEIGDHHSFYVVGKTDKNILLSLRRSHLGTTPTCLPDSLCSSQPDREINNIHDLTEGEVLRGYVKSTTRFGVFIKIGRGVVGRAMIKNLSDQYVSNYRACVTLGQLLRMKILNIDVESQKVELSLKLSDIDPSVANEMKEKKKRKRKRKAITMSEEDEDDDSSSERKEEEKEQEEYTIKNCDVILFKEEPPLLEKLTQSKEEATPKRKKRKLEQEREEESDLPPLPVSGGFTWDNTTSTSINTTEEREGEEEGESIEGTGKRSKRQKKAIKKAEEIRLYQKEHLLLDTSRVPESPDDFDRLLVANPNSSSLWLQYMAYYLHTAEVDKARFIAERGLNTVSFREEQEKLNLWVGLMNLENMYGSRESLEKVFQKALNQNEPITVHFKLVKIYESSEKVDLADDLYRSMIKKFREDVTVWNGYCFFLMKHGRLEGARKILQQSFTYLTKKHQIEVIAKFAQHEFKFGEMERGITMFESLLSSYPRRVDLWSVYIDMLLKKGQKDKVRDVFERSLSLKLSEKKKEFLSKRFVEFAKSHGESKPLSL